MDSKQPTDNGKRDNRALKEKVVEKAIKQKVETIEVKKPLPIQIKKKDVLVIKKPTIIEVKVNKQVVKDDRLDIYKITRTLVGNKEVGKNSGKVVDIVIKHTGLYKYAERPYCGATVQYCLDKANVKMPKDVKNPLAARGWFNENVIVYKGKQIGVYKIDPLMGDIAGFNFYGNNITHVGIYLKDSLGRLKIFEGNTSNPANKKQEGFFDKIRSKEITIIRKLI